MGEVLRAPANNIAIYRSGYSYDYFKRKLGRTKEERKKAKEALAKKRIQATEELFTKP